MACPKRFSGNKLGELQVNSWEHGMNTPQKQTTALIALIGALAVAQLKAESAASPGDRWPGFRGVGTSVSEAKDLPLKWSDAAGIAWQAELPGYGQSSPVVWGTRVFTTTMQGDEKQTPTVLCHDLATGKELWKRAFVATQTVQASNYVTRSSPTPLVDADKVYAFFESGELIALNHDGNEQWQRSLVKDYGAFEGNHGIGSSLAAATGELFVLVEHDGPSYLLAVSKTDGSNVWKQDYDARVSWSSPSVGTLAGEQVVITSGGGVAAAYEVKTGKLSWQHEGLSGANVPSPTLVDDSIYLGASESKSNVRLRKTPDAENGRVELVWQAKKATCSFNSPLVYRGVVYYVNRSGVAFALEASSGKSIWKQRIAGSCWASPLAVGDRIYFFCKSGEAVVVQAPEQGQTKLPTLLAENELSIAAETRVYGVAAVNSHLILRTGSRLICVSHE